jgi:hypothetical protein
VNVAADASADAPPSSCQDEIVATDAKGAGPLALDGDVVFWGTTDGFVRTRDASGTTTTLASESTPIDSIAVDASDVYYATIGAIHSVARAGGSSTVIVANAGEPFALARHDQRLFWIDYGAGILAGSVHSANTDGTGALTLLSQLDTPGGLSIDGTYVYVDAALAVVDQQSVTGPLIRANHDGANAQVVKAALNEPKSITEFGERVHWIEQTDATSSLHGGVFSIDANASSIPLLELPTDGMLPVDFAVDESGVWATALSQQEGGVLLHTGVTRKTPGVVYEAVRTSATAVYWTIGWTSTRPEDGASVRKLCK